MTQIIKGKVKTVFTTSEPDKVLIQYEDRVTAGNGKKIDFPQGKGKVKTVFTTSEPDKVLIQYEDRVTAGNGKKVDYPEGKGKVCMEISAFYFKS